MTVPADDEDGRGVTLVVHGDERVAALIHDPSLRENEQLMKSVCAAAGLALTNARLQAELRGRLEDLRASRARLVQVGDQERRRLERDLHDGAQQRLLSTLLELQRITPESDRASIDRMVSSAQVELRRSLRELRELARGIHPSALTDHGLAVALEGVVARVPVGTALQVDLDSRPPPAAEAAAYFVVSEALANIAKHADASKAEVRIAIEGKNLRVEISDDGAGGADPIRGSGLRGLADRVAAVDGAFEIESSKGRGTLVRAVIPCG